MYETPEKKKDPPVSSKLFANFTVFSGEVVITAGSTHPDFFSGADSTEAALRQRRSARYSMDFPPVTGRIAPLI